MLEVFKEILHHLNENDDLRHVIFGFLLLGAFGLFGLFLYTFTP